MQDTFTATDWFACVLTEAFVQTGAGGLVMVIVMVAVLVA